MHVTGGAWTGNATFSDEPRPAGQKSSPTPAAPLPACSRSCQSEQGYVSDERHQATPRPG